MREPDRGAGSALGVRRGSNRQETKVESPCPKCRFQYDRFLREAVRGTSARGSSACGCRVAWAMRPSDGPFFGAWLEPLRLVRVRREEERGASVFGVRAYHGASFRVGFREINHRIRSDRRNRGGRGRRSQPRSIDGIGHRERVERPLFPPLRRRSGPGRAVNGATCPAGGSVGRPFGSGVEPPRKKTSARTASGPTERFGNETLASQSESLGSTLHRMPSRRRT